MSFEWSLGYKCEDKTNIFLNCLSVNLFVASINIHTHRFIYYSLLNNVQKIKDKTWHWIVKKMNASFNNSFIAALGDRIWSHTFFEIPQCSLWGDVFDGKEVKDEQTDEWSPGCPHCRICQVTQPRYCLTLTQHDKCPLTDFPKPVIKVSFVCKYTKQILIHLLVIIRNVIFIN